MGIKEILRSRLLWIHLILMVLVSLALFWLGLRMLDVYTRHGSGYVVPDFSGMTHEEITTNPVYDQFRVVVSDSVYDNSRTGGIVIDQDPLAGSEVKRNRTVHLVIVSKMQDMVSLPDLGNTVRSARSQLETQGLQLGEVKEVQGEFVGLLQRAFYMGREVEQGAKIPRGSIIDIEVSVGPDLPVELEESTDTELPPVQWLE
jgi:eukaryotic-like serine/threonine-protein kinase